MERWRELAQAQAWMITRSQLRSVGVSRSTIRRRCSSDRWVIHSPTVIGTTTGELTREQLMWLGVLHAGEPALVGDLTAAEVHAMKNWHREEITILVPQGSELGRPFENICYVETRRDLKEMRDPRRPLPTCRLKPALLRFAAYHPSTRTADGVLAAAVQQRLTTPDRLLHWVESMRPLRRAAQFRRPLSDIAGGSQSAAELDVRRMCRTFGLTPPRRQTKRRDTSGRVRFTDCEWLLPSGRTLVLEVDGSFHMEVEHWEDDLARQRALTTPDRVVIHCTSREVRDTPETVAQDLINLGVPRVA